MTDFSPNKSHRALVEQLNAFNHKTASKRLFSAQHFWGTPQFVAFCVAVPVNMLTLANNIFLQNFNPLTLFGGVVSLGLFALFGWHIVRWKDNCARMKHPNFLALKKDDLRQMLLEMHAHDDRILPTLQEIEQRIEAADIVWVEYVSNIVRAYWRDVMLRTKVNVEQYGVIRAPKIDKHLKL